MSYARPMLDTYPRTFNVDAELLATCIEACYDCAQACTACGDDCLSEEGVAELIKCIRLNSDCADICIAAGRVLSRQTEYDANVTRGIVGVCAVACRTCRDECTRHAEHHEHCEICANACSTCEDACNRLLAAIS